MAPSTSFDTPSPNATGGALNPTAPAMSQKKKAVSPVPAKATTDRGTKRPIQPNKLKLPKKMKNATKGMNSFMISYFSC